MKQKIKRGVITLTGGMLLLGFFLLLQPTRVEAHACVDVTGFSCNPGTHNTLGHLAETAFSVCETTFGTSNCNNAKNAGEAFVEGAGDVVNKALECTTGFDAAGNCVTEGVMAAAKFLGDASLGACKAAASGLPFTEGDCDAAYEVIQQAVQGGVNCFLNPAACAANAGLTPALFTVSVLQGTVTMEALPIAGTPVDQGLFIVVTHDPLQTSPACLLAITASIQSYPAQKDIPYNIPVSACAEVTYVITPRHPLYTWNPPSRRVIVGGGLQASLPIDMIPTEPDQINEGNANADVDIGISSTSDGLESVGRDLSGRGRGPAVDLDDLVGGTTDNTDRIRGGNTTPQDVDSTGFQFSEQNLQRPYQQHESTQDLLSGEQVNPNVETSVGQQLNQQGVGGTQGQAGGP